MGDEPEQKRNSRREHRKNEQPDAQVGIVAFDLPDRQTIAVMHCPAAANSIMARVLARILIPLPTRWPVYEVTR